MLAYNLKNTLVNVSCLSEYKNKKYIRVNKKELEQAIFNDELRLHYQPRYRIGSGKAIVLEALVRWQHPVHGLLCPDEFISLAESSGLIHWLGTWVIKQSCLDIHQLYQNRVIDKGVRISINVSVLQCEHPQTAYKIKKIIQKHGLSLNNFEFELTESLPIHDEESVIEFCQVLAGEGAEISLDDFGTGQSSLIHLSRIPVNTVKIDKQFVGNLAETGRDNTLIKHIIRMSHDLGVRVVAEGVEDREQLQMLSTMGCDELQGYYMCKPVTRNAISKWNMNMGWLH